MDDFVRTVPGIPHTQFFIGANHFAAWDLIRAIEEDRLPVSNIYNARKTLEMIYGIYASHLKAGARVAAGQTLGTVGQTGNATGAHLHFEILHRGLRYDPAEALENAA